MHLPPKAVELLIALVESGGRVLTKDELMGRVWADSFVEETNLTHNISLLRRILGDRQNGEKFIETIPRRGYRFVADVHLPTNGDYEIYSHDQTEISVVTEEEFYTGDEVSIAPIERQSAARLRRPNRALAGSLFGLAGLAIVLGL